MLATLVYIHDPMCSWCWGFRPVWLELKKALKGKVDIGYVLGGLAPDTDKPMPDTMQNTIQDTWRKIEQEIPGTRFNYDFWTDCSPRRSTYASCRAVLACRMQQPALEQQMLLAIQQAYYLRAKNPSDDGVLISLAAEIGLDVEKFSIDLNSETCNKHLIDDISLARDLYVYSFPSLVLLSGKSSIPIDIHYTQHEIIFKQIAEKLAAFSER